MLKKCESASCIYNVNKLVHYCCFYIPIRFLFLYTFSVLHYYFIYVPIIYFRVHGALCSGSPEPDIRLFENTAGNAYLLWLLLNNELILSRNVKTAPFSYPRKLNPITQIPYIFHGEGRYRTTCEIHFKSSAAQTGNGSKKSLSKKLISSILRSYRFLSSSFFFPNVHKTRRLIESLCNDSISYNLHNFVYAYIQTPHTVSGKVFPAAASKSEDKR